MLIDWFTVGAQAVNFLILVWLMKRFLYKPVLAAIDAREKKIAAELQQAAAAQSQAQKERDGLRVQTESLQRQREELLRAAVADAGAQRQHLLDTARKESEDLRSKLTEAATVERAELNREVAARTRQEVFALTRKTLVDLADTTLEDQMLAVFIRRVGEMNDVQKSEVLPVVPVRTHAALAPAVLRSAFDLTPAQQVNIAAAFREWPCRGASLQFETSPDLISGLEITVAGRKLAWSVTAYLGTVEKKVETLLAAADENAPAPGTDVQHAA
jgi:F-type H+-transporting ATPase subunit b